MKYIRSRPVIGSEEERSSAGHNFINWSTGLFLAKRFNLEYIHTPFGGDSVRFNEFLNFHSMWRQKEDIKPARIVNNLVSSHHYFSSDDRLHSIQEQIDTYPNNTLIDLPQDSYPGILTQYYNDIIPDLQKAYWGKHRDIPLVYDSSKIGVAMHIRRGDVKENTNPNRWLTLDYYLTIIDNLNDVLGSENIDIHIFSEGVEKDFEPLVRKNISLHLGGCDLSVFHNMCSSNILVMGLSAYSYLAAYINRGVVLYTPFAGASGEPEAQYTYNWGDDRMLLVDGLDYQRVKKALTP